MEKVVNFLTKLCFKKDKDPRFGSLSCLVRQVHGDPFFFLSAASLDLQ